MSGGLPTLTSLARAAGTAAHNAQAKLAAMVAILRVIRILQRKGRGAPPWLTCVHAPDLDGASWTAAGRLYRCSPMPRSGGAILAPGLVRVNARLSTLRFDEGGLLESTGGKGVHDEQAHRALSGEGFEGYFPAYCRVA